MDLKNTFVNCLLQQALPFGKVFLHQTYIYGLTKACRIKVGMKLK
jgi:hypothetical protein